LAEMKKDNNLVLETNGICYEVFIPTTVRERIDDAINAEGKIELITYHYHHVEPSRSVPVLIGFLNDVEREFFETFITVSGIGPRAALRALNKPISQIAQAIDEADSTFLQSLPGIGQQRAREIIAKLQHKIGKFCLIQDAEKRLTEKKASDIEEESLQILEQLQYKRPEALKMVKKAIEGSPQLKTTEELLNEVYKQKKYE